MTGPRSGQGVPHHRGTPWPGQDEGLPHDGGIPPPGMGYPLWDWTADGVLDTAWSVCLLRSRRRTFLLHHYISLTI